MGLKDVKIFAVAGVSRVLWLLVSCTADWLLRDYDTSAHLNERPCNNEWELEAATEAVLFADVWDTVYFERISRCGYEFEHYLAFFPGMPLLMSWMPGNAATTVVHGLVVTTLAFCLSAVLMYR